MSTQISHDLTNFYLSTYNLNLQELESYYIGDHPPRMFTETQRSKPDFKRFFAPLNFCKVIVDEPVGYFANAQVTITCEDELIQEWLNGFYRRRIQPIVPTLVKDQALFGEAYAYLWHDTTGFSRGVKVRGLPPVEAGEERLEAEYAGNDETELKSAVMYYSKPSPAKGSILKYRITMDESEIVEEYQDSNSSQWRLERRFPNFLQDTVPLVPLFNGTGISDILQVIPVQDDINKLHFDLRLNREYQGFPMLVTSEDVPANMSIAPGQVLDNAGDMRRIEAGDIAPLLSEHANLVETMSVLGTSLALADRSGSNLSGVALRYLQQQFESKLAGKANQLANTYTNILRIAAKYATAYQELYQAEVLDTMDIPVPLSVLASDFHFDVDVQPTIPADEDAQSERAIKLFQAGLADRATAMNIAGIPDADIVAEKIDTEIAASDLALRVEKVRLGLELGVSPVVLARELGYSVEDFDNESTDSTDSEEIRTEIEPFTGTQPSEDTEDDTPIISTDSDGNEPDTP